MNDLVKRLRAVPSKEVIGLTHGLAKEAADRIEELERRLLAQLSEAKEK